MPQTSKITISLAGELSAALDFEAAVSKLSKLFSIELADGSGAGQAANIFSDQRTLAASATENLDLNGALLNAFGQVISFTKIKALAIFAAEANVNDVVVGGAAANGFIAPFGAATHTVSIKPGGALVLVAPNAVGYAVVAATADLLKILNSGAGTPVTYDIVIIGS